MTRSISRIPAPSVPPVVHGGVRYEQVGNGLLEGLDQMGGYLAAVDEKTGERLWVLKVYDNRRQPGREGDAQDVFFRSMAWMPDNTLRIVNERGAGFVVDPATRSVHPDPAGH